MEFDFNDKKHFYLLDRLEAIMEHSFLTGAFHFRSLITGIKNNESTSIYPQYLVFMKVELEAFNSILNYKYKLIVDFIIKNIKENKDYKKYISQLNSSD